MIRIVDTMQTPPGGWRYEQPETGYVMTSGSLAGLISKIQEHRKGNAIEAGDPERDVHEFICAKSPELCMRQTAIIEKPGLGLEDVRAFAETVKAIVAKRGEGCYVESEQAEKRAAVCVSCPHNKRLPGCTPCQGIANLVSLNRETSRDDSLKQCAVCGCFLSSKVHLTNEVILETQAKDYTFPDWCWVGKP